MARATGMWAIFKSILLDGMERYIPKTKNMTTLKCSTLQPFNSDIKQLIHKKHRAWTRFMETRSVMQEYKRLRNQVGSEARKIRKLKQDSVANHVKSNHKH